MRREKKSMKARYAHLTRLKKLAEELKEMNEKFDAMRVISVKDSEVSGLESNAA